MTIGLQSVAWSGASGFEMLWDTTTIPALSVTLPDYEITTKKVRRLGEQLPTKRTIGAADITTLKVVIEASDYTTIILPRQPRHSGTLLEFVCTCTINHPSVLGSYGLLLDGCRIVKHPGFTIEPDENEIRKELEIDVMAMWEKGLDGIWKALSEVPTLPSSQAIAAMSF